MNTPARWQLLRQNITESNHRLSGRQVYHLCLGNYLLQYFSHLMVTKKMWQLMYSACSLIRIFFSSMVDLIHRYNSTTPFSFLLPCTPRFSLCSAAQSIANKSERGRGASSLASKTNALQSTLSDNINTAPYMN